MDVRRGWCVVTLTSGTGEPTISPRRSTRRAAPPRRLRPAGSAVTVRSGRIPASRGRAPDARPWLAAAPGDLDALGASDEHVAVGPARVEVGVQIDRGGPADRRLPAAVTVAVRPQAAGGRD